MGKSICIMYQTEGYRLDYVKTSLNSAQEKEIITQRGRGISTAESENVSCVLGKMLGPISH